MKKGILYVSFGQKCDYLLAHTMAYSRKYTNLPILVLTNVPEQNRTPAWKGIKNIEFKYFNLPDNHNRVIKTTQVKYTTFEKTIYLDADSIVQNDGFEELFDDINDESVLLNKNHCFEKNCKIPNLYMRAVNTFKLESPLLVYNGAFIGYAKNEKTKGLFDLWNKYWVQFGKAREMPCLAAALQKYSLNINTLEKGVFSPDVKNLKSIVQHNYFQDFFQRIGIEGIIELPVQQTNTTDFSFTIWK